MPHFVFIGHDAPGALERRKAARPAHLQHWSALVTSNSLHFAGPLLNDDSPVGSLIIFTANSLAEAKALTDADPYMAAGVFASTELRPTKQVLP